MARVLVIEDNEDFRELIRHWLEAAGFSVSTLPNGRLSAAKIIAMSGRESLTDYDVLRVADELGAVKTFKKPFDLDDLVQAVRELAGDSR